MVMSLSPQQHLPVTHPSTYTSVNKTRSLASSWNQGLPTCRPVRPLRHPVLGPLWTTGEAVFSVALELRGGRSEDLRASPGGKQRDDRRRRDALGPPAPATQVCDVKTLLVHGPKDCPLSCPTTTWDPGPVWRSLRISTKPATLSIASSRGIGSNRADVGSSVSQGVMTHVACPPGQGRGNSCWEARGRDKQEL